METFIMIASSVLTTLGIIGAVWLIFSVRSMQKQLNDYVDDTTEVHSRIDKFEDDIYKELAKLDHEMDKRFDNNYRTMYDFRDWAKEQIERLIETDLKNK